MCPRPFDALPIPSARSPKVVWGPWAQRGPGWIKLSLTTKKGTGVAHLGGAALDDLEGTQTLSGRLYGQDRHEPAGIEGVALDA